MLSKFIRKYIVTGLEQHGYIVSDLYDLSNDAHDGCKFVIDNSIAIEIYPDDINICIAYQDHPPEYGMWEWASATSNEEILSELFQLIS